jgi:hypothetical protein
VRPLTGLVDQVFHTSAPVTYDGDVLEHRLTLVTPDVEVHKYPVAVLW